MRLPARGRLCTPRLGPADTLRGHRRAGCPAARDSAARPCPPAPHPRAGHTGQRSRTSGGSDTARAEAPRTPPGLCRSMRGHGAARDGRDTGRAEAPRGRTDDVASTGRSVVRARTARGPAAPRLGAADTVRGIRRAQCPAGRDSAARHPPPTAARTHAPDESDTARAEAPRTPPARVASAGRSCVPARPRGLASRDSAPRTPCGASGADGVRLNEIRQRATRRPRPHARTHPTKATQPVRKRRALPRPVSLDARAWSRPRPKRHRACGSAARSHRRCRFRRSVGWSGARSRAAETRRRGHSAGRSIRRVSGWARLGSAPRLPRAPRAAPTARTRPGRARPRRPRS